MVTFVQIEDSVTQKEEICRWDHSAVEGKIVSIFHIATVLLRNNWGLQACRPIYLLVIVGLIFRSKEVIFIVGLKKNKMLTVFSLSHINA